MSTVADLATRLRDDLRSALRARDLATVKVLRTMVAAIANAEAVPVSDTGAARPAGAGTIAGATSGLGSAEAPRRELTDDDVRALVAGERDDLLAAAAQSEAHAPDRARELRAAADLLSAYL
ncbi:hypothetical protein RB608_02125 [Nocardioides sp. LHD-245]|uniref:hypothetical protein n=1 Tax=Nocardioides sp. LHD-245 TaxID=3051387 RepID=UPI0027E0707C|nr:hypothetical protein [Nocardioides sp. LHD-245]